MIRRWILGSSRFREVPNCDFLHRTHLVTSDWTRPSVWSTARTLTPHHTDWTLNSVHSASDRLRPKILESHRTCRSLYLVLNPEPLSLCSPDRTDRTQPLRWVLPAPVFGERNTPATSPPLLPRAKHQVHLLVHVC